MEPVLTTLCYIESENRYLMLHRIKKEHDLNKDKYIGVGGHIEYGESPDECLRREVFEETGYRNLSYKMRGLITFIYGNADVYDERIVEYLHLYTAFFDPPQDLSTGANALWRVPECDEGVFEWIEKERVCTLPIWEGDKIFFKLLNERQDFFSLKLVYNEKDALTEAWLDGEKLDI